MKTVEMKQLKFYILPFPTKNSINIKCKTLSFLVVRGFDNKCVTI